VVYGAGEDQGLFVLPAIAAARTTARDEFLAAERQTSPSAPASRDMYVDFVNEHRIW